jgi:hypothetical protein
MRYCGFMWAWMFERAMQQPPPHGKFVLVADMSGLKLSLAVGEGQVRGLVAALRLCVAVRGSGSWLRQ